MTPNVKIDSTIIRQFGRFLIVGGLSFTMDFGLFTLLYFIGVPYLIASITSFSLSVILNYWLSRKFVFDVQEGVSIAKEFTAYAALNVIALGLNTLILYVCAEFLGFNPIIGKIIATGVVLIFNFITRKALIEKLGARAAAKARKN